MRISIPFECGSSCLAKLALSLETFVSFCKTSVSQYECNPTVGRDLEELF